MIFLSNRVHPDGKGDVTALRGKIATVAAAALLSPADVSALREARDGVGAAGERKAAPRRARA